MMKTTIGWGMACAVALMASVTVPAVAQTGKTELVTSGAMQPTAGKAKTAAKKAAKPAKKGGKSCGTFKYPDKKTGKCVDARDKKR
jgi:hypothetical protein